MDRHRLLLSRYINKKRNRREMFFNSFKLKAAKILCADLPQPEESVRFREFDSV